MKQQIGGYPTFSQIAETGLDATTLDSEGRCVVLEFPAFVLIGTYCPANRDETRDEFRIGFLTAVDARIRNLVAMGKRVFWTGDLNIIRDELDTANGEEQLKKQGISIELYISTPARRMLNHLLVDGRVVGERDKGREKPVMWDICRSFHPTRKGMFTCWEQKINARPGNFGSRIDYVLCSEDWRDWFCESDIQEGLMGSDHCPVYAILKHKVDIEGKEVYIKDIMSAGMFKNGVRQREWSPKDLLPMSAKLIPEFDRRRSIRDMFTKKHSMPKTESSATIPEVTAESSSATNEAAIPPEGSSFVMTVEAAESSNHLAEATGVDFQEDTQSNSPLSTQTTNLTNDTQLMRSPAKPAKRPLETAATSRAQKRSKNVSSKTSAATKGQPGKGQSTLQGFFKPRAPAISSQTDGTESQDSAADETQSGIYLAASDPTTPAPSESFSIPDADSPSKFDISSQKDVVDPIVAKESWSKLLGKRVVPKCEHGEACISMLTKKPGVNMGRSFYMCPRPIGPSGQKEKNTQWRCGTFIWSSEWTGGGS